MSPEGLHLNACEQLLKRCAEMCKAAANQRFSSLNSRWSMRITAWQATSRTSIGSYLQVPEQLLQPLCWLR